MMKLKAVFGLVLIALAIELSSPAHALGNIVDQIDSSSLQSTVVDPSCRLRPDDPFDLGWRFTSNSHRYSGQCVESRAKRPIQILQDGPDGMQFANVLRHGRYWTATWNKNNNRPRVQFFSVHFDAGVPLVTAGHTELHFIFPEPLELVSQTSGERAQLQNLVVAWEANLPVKTGFNVLAGLMPNDAIAGRVVSLESRIPENILPSGQLRQTDIYNLRLTSREGAALFMASLRASHELGYSHFYRTLGPNCTSQLFDVMDGVLATTQKEKMSGVARFKTLPSADPIIGPGRAALVERGLIDEQTRPGSLGDCLRGEPGPLQFNEEFFSCVNAVR